jgi:Methyltransferase domain
MKRSEVINRFAQRIDAQRYLEIGVNKGETFLQVDIPDKTGVDPLFLFDYESKASEAARFFNCPSDQFFRERPLDDTRPYDIVYIDGLHTFDQVVRDLTNSLGVLSKNGVVVIDDVVPDNYFASLPDHALFRKLRERKIAGSASWMGDVYKILFFIDSYLWDWTCFTYQLTNNYFQAVVWKSSASERGRSRGRYDLSDIVGMDYSTFLLECKNVLNLSTVDAISKKFSER